MTEFKDKLRMALARVNMTQAELARAVGRAPSKVTEWLNPKEEVGPQGPPLPRAPEMVKISRLLDVPLLYLCDPDVGDPAEVVLVEAHRSAAGPALSAEEQAVLEAARKMGLERAWRRLFAIPDGESIPTTGPVRASDTPLPRKPDNPGRPNAHANGTRSKKKS